MKCYRMPIIRYTHPHQPVKPLSTRLSPESATDIGDRALAIAQRHWIWLGASDAVANIVGASAQVATWPLRLATMFATTPESRFFDPWCFVASGVFANMIHASAQVAAWPLRLAIMFATTPDATKYLGN